MYVCICNGVTEDDVRGCLSAGAATTREVKEACGWKPGCGSCTKRLCALVSQQRTADELVNALTGGPLPLETVPAPDGPLVPVLADVPEEDSASPTAA